MTAQIRVFFKNGNAIVRAFDSRVIRVGSSPKADLSLPESSLASTAFLVERHPATGDFHVQCRGDDPVMYGGAPLPSRAVFQWKPGTEFQCGDVRFLLDVEKTAVADPRVTDDDDLSEEYDEDDDGREEPFAHAPPPLSPATAVSSNNRADNPPTDTSQTVKLVVIGIAILGCIMTIIVGLLMDKANTTTKIDYGDVYKIAVRQAELQRLEADFPSRLAEARRKESFAPNEAMKDYVQLQRTLTAELDGHHPSEYDDLGRVLAYINMKIGTLHRPSGRVR